MKKILVMAAAMLFSLQGIHAQTDVTEETDSDDIITVTDKDGKQEEIEVPEGMEGRYNLQIPRCKPCLREGSVYRPSEENAYHHRNAIQ